jgi:hypothetical protein
MGTFEMAGLGTLTKSIGSDGVLHATVTIPLTPYAVIAGKITEPSGVERSGTGVSILSKQGDAFTTVATVQADDRGDYRAARLAPGTYYVVANKLGPWMTIPANLRTTYYPRVLDAASATPLTLTAGQQLRADIQMRCECGGAAVSGKIAPADDDTTLTRVLLYQPEIEGRPNDSLAFVKNGEFAMWHVMPGRYTLLALKRARDGGPKKSGTPLAAALQQVEVGDQDMAGLQVDLQPLRDLAGTVTFAQGCPAVPVRVRVQGRNALGGSGLTTSPRPDGSFTLSGLVPARHTVTVTAPSGYSATATMGSRDVLKDGLYYPAAEGETLNIAVGCTGIGSAQ